MNKLSKHKSKAFRTCQRLPSSARRLIVLAFGLGYTLLLIWLHSMLQTHDGGSMPFGIAREGTNEDILAHPPHLNADASSQLSTTSATSAVASTNATENATWRNLTTAEIDAIRNLKGWDGQPVVILRYKLIVFTQPKIASTAFKQLLRRMMRYNDWNVHQEPILPHDPRYNKLRYLRSHVVQGKWGRMMTGSDWTRAIFVRDPKTRVLSAYLDKVQRKDASYMQRHCPNVPSNVTTWIQFLESVVRQCPDPHWKPQSQRMDAVLWPLINFVGHFENLAQDAKCLLDRLSPPDAWSKYGADGWGRHGNESMFGKNTQATHSTHSSALMEEYFRDPDVDRLVEELYASDYSSKFLGLQK